jgi:hypothetical protein
MLPFSFEIYTKNPQTGDGGWEIKTGYVVNAATREIALNKIKMEYPNFDTVIELHQIAGFNGNETDPILIIPQKF